MLGQIIGKGSDMLARIAVQQNNEWRMLCIKGINKTCRKLETISAGNRKIFLFHCFSLA